MSRARLYKNELFDLASAAPSAELAPYVARYTAWRDRVAYTVRRRHLPSGRVPLIVNFETRVRQFVGGRSTGTEQQTFMSGLHDTYTISESAGRNSGVQVDFTALGARLFYGRPLRDLANRSVALDELFGAGASRLTLQLFEAANWDERFDVLDREIRSRVFSATPLKREIAWVSERLTRAAGNVPIATLAGEIGWSTRHVTTQFQNEFGLRPKAFARVLRFSRATAAMSRDAASSLADVAAGAGYFDQAHFIRDVREFAGVTPQALRRGENS
jgi:AraC-like DNA-binding protein